MLFEDSKEHEFAESVCVLSFVLQTVLEGLLSVFAGSVEVDSFVEPGVLLQGQDGDSFAGVFLETEVDEVATVGGDLHLLVVPVRTVEHSVDDALKADSFGASGEEGRTVEEHHVGQDTQRPDVAFRRVLFSS